MDKDPVTTHRPLKICFNTLISSFRLYRILQKNKFEEAEKFANLFQLDIEVQSKLFITSLIITEYSISDINLLGMDLFL